MRVLRICIPAPNLPPAMIVIGIAEFLRLWSIVQPPAPKGEAHVIVIIVRIIPGIVPVVSGVIDHHIQKHAHITGVCCLYKINQILLGAKTRIDIEVVLNGIAMIAAGVRIRGTVVLKDGTYPERRASKVFDVVQMVTNPPQGTTADLAQSLCCPVAFSYITSVNPVSPGVHQH